MARLSHVVCNALKILMERRGSGIEKTSFAHYRYIPPNHPAGKRAAAPVPHSQVGMMYEDIGHLADGRTVLKSESGTLHLVTLA